MESKNVINVDLDDPRIGKIADVINNKSAKKVLSEISEYGKEGLSESDLVERLNMKANTVNYNIKKLEGSGLIEKVSGFLWSVKGKRVHRYKVSNRKIVISPKSRTGIIGIFGTAVVAGVIALIIKLNGIGSQIGIRNDLGENMAYKVAPGVVSDSSAGAVERTTELAGSGAISYAQADPNVWAWFLLGALAALLIFVLWSWRQNGNKE